MGEVFGHVLVVLPAFLLACLAVAALPGPSTALFLHRTVRDWPGPVFGTTVALASVQLVLDSTYCVLVVLLASRARRWLSRAAIRRRLERALGATLVALGIDLAAASR